MFRSAKQHDELTVQVWPGMFDFFFAREFFNALFIFSSSQIQFRVRNHSCQFYLAWLSLCYWTNWCHISCSYSMFIVDNHARLADV